MIFSENRVPLFGIIVLGRSNIQIEGTVLIAEPRASRAERYSWIMSFISPQRPLWSRPIFRARWCWSFKVAARSAPIRAGSIRPCTKPASSRTGSSAPRSAASTPRLSPATRFPSGFHACTPFGTGSKAGRPGATHRGASSSATPAPIGTPYWAASPATSRRTARWPGGRALPSGSSMRRSTRPTACARPWPSSWTSSG